MCYYLIIIDSKRWEPTDIKEQFLYEPLTLRVSTGEIEEPVIKTSNKSDFKICHNGKDNESGGYASTESVETCHEWFKYGHRKVIANPIEIVLFGINPRGQQE